MHFDLSLKISLLPLSFFYCVIDVMSLCLMVVFHPLHAIFFCH